MPKSFFSLQNLAELVVGFLTKSFLFFFPFHAAAWNATAEPIQRLLNADTENEKDRLTALWQNSTQSQLTSVGITSALVSGVVASGFTWPNMTGSSWTVKATWYSSLVLALTSICAATQQAIALYRLSSHPRGWVMIRTLLSNDPTDGSSGQLEPRLLQLYIWQIPVSLLNGSVYFFLAGLAVLLWDAGRSVHLNWAKADTKIVTIFMITLSFAVSHYVLSTVGIYGRIRKVNNQLNAEALD